MKKIFKKHSALILLGVLCSLAMRFASTKAQFIKGRLLDAAIQKNSELLPGLILSLLAALVFSGILLYLFALINRIFIEKTTRSLRGEFFKSLLNRSYKGFFKLNQGETIAKYSKEIGIISSNCFSLVGMLTQMTLQLVFVSAALIYLNFSLALISLAVLSLPIFVPRFFQKRMSEAAKQRLKSSEQNISNINGILNSFEIIKNFSIEKNIYRNFEKSNEELFASENRFERAHAVTVGTSFAVSLGTQAIILILSALYVYWGLIKMGDFLTIAGLISSIRVPLYWISTLFQRLIATKPTIKSVFDFINDENSLDNKKSDYEKNEKLEERKQSLKASENLLLEIRGLCYGYEDGKDILNDISLSFSKNKKYLLHGESGCGKSTLMKLLLNYYEPRKGQILLCETPIQDIDKIEELITISRQEASIFSGSVRDNLSMFSSDFSDDELIKILHSVGLSGLAEEGLDYMLEENGGNLSGGEKKRLSLARALIRKTPILILDEPFANIDNENMDKIEDLIFSIKDRLLIIISHQISERLAKNMDQIIRLEGGKINAQANI